MNESPLPEPIRPKLALHDDPPADVADPPPRPDPDQDASARLHPSRADLYASLQRMEARLAEIRTSLEQVTRERRHKEFSPARLVGAILQVLVIGLVGFALLDWVFAADASAILVKLGFGLVFQMAALTAFWSARSTD